MPPPRAFPEYHWVRLARGHCGGPIVTAYHWVRLAPRHWLRLGKRPHRPNWLRLGMAHVGGASTLFGTQHIITDQWVRLDKRFHGRSGRFLDPSCRDTHWVRLAPRHWLRLVKRPHRPNWLRSGMAHVGGASTLFGTQHIITDQWVRLDKRFHGRSGRFLDPSCRDTHWVPLKIGADTTAIMQTRPRPFSSGRVTIPMVMTVRLVRGIRGCTLSQLTIGFVWRGARQSIWLRVRIELTQNRDEQGGPSSTNTIEDGAGPFHVFLRRWQRNPRRPR